MKLRNIIIKYNFNEEFPINILGRFVIDVSFTCANSCLYHPEQWKNS